ncbi:hypothetical protein GV819_20810 [Pseudomonas sp. Fl5BN2]|uniref:hypothetical protein n=1 Tax=Pseudomonas sp. Fl5BN2 TaxID=2697652 RepID=UPI001378E9E8|nr:hypothetical protein [Pseudomonas sp. Fl5BN2]NBF04728.1 hypothetical protein [Pseudomonas sp. Fl5BN2]
MNELTQLQAAITSTIKAAMPHLHTVEAFPKALDGSSEPAIYLAIIGLDQGPDPGDGRSCMRATFEARALVDPSLAQAPLQAAILAAQLIELLRCQHWALDFVEGATAVSAKPAGTSAEPVQSAEWIVQWQQLIYLGQEQWPWPNQPPGTLVLGFSPDIGPGHEADYQSPEQME